MLLAVLQFCLELVQRYRLFFPAFPNQFPERRVGLEDDVLPVVAFNAHEHRRRPTVPRDDDSTFLLLVDTLFDVLLQVTHADSLHRIPSVRFARGFFLTALTIRSDGPRGKIVSVRIQRSK